MASAVAPKGGIPLAFFLKEHIASPSAAKEKAAAVAAAHRFFSTLCDDSTEDPSNVDTGDDRRRARSLAFAKLISGDADLFDEATKLSLLLSLMDMEGGGAASKIGFYPGGCVSKEDGDAVHLTVAMPGLGKEHVEMRAEKDVLVIKGEGDKDSAGGDDKVPARYSYRIDLSSQTQAFKMDQIKAEMKNGVLKVTVPKIKDEERKDVFQIKIE